jgi:GT2 family glycosyltransferase/glycosyltransferase involved in cell wall biosynthesis
MDLLACLSIDLDWTRRRHPAVVHGRLVEAAADPSRRRQILADLSVDFSPYLSLDRLNRQFLDYDFSVGDELRDFLLGRCAADDYCSPQWLYDDRFYRLEHLDIEAALRRGEKALGFFHFLAYGMHEGRRGHRLFEPSWYCKNRGDISANQAFVDFVTGGVFEDLPTCALFDPEFYRTLYPEVRTEILNGRYSCSLEHFIDEGAARGLVPSADWDAEYYLKCNPDVADGIAEGIYSSPFAHWLENGIRENRSPNQYFDAKYYLEAYPAAAAEIRDNWLLGAFEHFASLGRVRGWRGRAALHTVHVPEEFSKALYAKRCHLSVFRVHGGKKIVFPREENPFFSVMISAYDNFSYNIRILELLEYAYHYTKSKCGIGFEVVVVDNGSSDETVNLLDYVEGLVFERVSPNIGFPRACNLGARLASGRYIVFMNNDMEFEPDIFVQLHDAVERDRDEVACFGAAILQFDGRIQDIGSGIWQDGSASGYFRDESPARYSLVHARDVDYVAGCFFCISRADFHAADGFDERFSPGYYEEADLCLRLWASGKKVRVYPDIRIYHLEYGAFSSGKTPRASTSLMARNRVLFAQKHKELVSVRPPFVSNANHARQSVGSRLRILVIEDMVPSLALGSGFGRSEIIVRELLKLADVDVFANSRAGIGKLPEDLEYLNIYFGPEPELLGRVLEYRDYDLIYVCRTHNVSRYYDLLRAWKMRTGAAIICDTEAIASVRVVTRAEGLETFSEILASPRLAVLLDDELKCLTVADSFVVVNQFDAQILKSRFAKPVHTIGHHLARREAAADPGARHGLLFVGTLYDRNAPNYDSLAWFLAHVWPRITAARPEEVLRIVGPANPGVTASAFEQSGVSYLGPVENLREEYARARLFIAPTRFAAGIPFKVHEAWSNGLPVVASTLLGEQLTATGDLGGALLAATVRDDGEEFAAACLRVLTDDELWAELRGAAIRYLEKTCAPALLGKSVARLLDKYRIAHMADTVDRLLDGAHTHDMTSS